jgi:hypothetical protein
VGVYAEWAVLALTRARGQIPVTSDRGLLVLALSAGLACLRPEVGPASLAGGAAGGTLGALIAPLLARAAFAAVALPVGAALAAARLAIETAKLAAGIVAALLVATWRSGVEVVRTVRGI